MNSVLHLEKWLCNLGLGEFENRIGSTEPPFIELELHLCIFRSGGCEYNLVLGDGGATVV